MVSTELKPCERSFETTPIFVLGLQRSGTTWLANLLCQHESCAGIQSDDHNGIHESVFFSHFSRSYGDLNVEKNFERFVRDFAQSDYFLLSNLSRKWFADLPHRSYGAIFYDLMERVARREGATHWVEKSPHHALYSQELSELFPNARFICLLRKPSSLIPSLLNAPWRQRIRYPLRALDILRSCVTYTLYKKHLLYFARSNPNAIVLRYEDLVAHPEDELRRLCLFLGFEYKTELLDVPYKRNSSFRSNQERSNVLSHLDRLCIQVCLTCLQLMPCRLLASANKLKQLFRPEPWPDWVWRRCPLDEDPPAIKAERA